MTDQNLATLQPGTIISGRYEVVKCLGAGSMGLVYACRHRELAGHLVAVKVLFPDVAKDNVAAARFRNEIVASYGVSHPNVVRAYEYFRDGDLVAYTMEFVGGGDLADRLAHGEQMPIGVIVRYMSQISSGVQAIHDAGIVHRDLKPENILLTHEGDVKITDFGIARTGHGPKLTEHGGVVGTIDYVSPEYLERGQVDARSDIYAMGVLGYEMITGQSPFKGDSVIATMTARLRTDPQSPLQLRPDCPPKLNEIILKAMERNPELRYQTSAEMFRDLQELGGSEGHSGLGSEAKRPSQNNKLESTGLKSEREVVHSKVFGSDAPASLNRPRKEEQSDTTDIVVSRPFMTELVEELSDDYDGSEVTPAHREQASDDFRRPSTIPVAVQGIGNDRIKALSQSVYREKRNSLLNNLIIVVVAVVVGVAVGFGFLRYMWPDFFAKGTKYSIDYDAGFEGLNFK